MPFFQSLAEIFASLTPRHPRREQSDDQQRSETYSHHDPEHRFTSRRLSNSQPSIRHRYALGSAADDDLSLPRRLPSIESAARLQVCDTQATYQ